MSVYPWNDERVALLRKCIAEGLSSIQTAKRINAETESSFTRNAVIGKVIRLGIYRPTTASKPRALSTPTLKSKPPKNPLGAKHRQSRPNQGPLIWGVPTATEPKRPSFPARKAEARAYDETSRKLTCIELTSATCKFGTHEEDGDHKFCGHAVRPGSPYCDHHHARCHLPTSSAKELTRSLRRYAA